MVAAIIVAAGKGTRMGPNVDKLFLELNGVPVVAHTWKTFDAMPVFGSLTLVVRQGMESHFHELAARFGFSKRYRLVQGGNERQDSVWNGLEGLPPDAEFVAIQDAARPCTSQELILETIKAAKESGAAVAAQAVVDTIKESADGQFAQRTLDRAKLWAVQTPQTFRVEVIRRAMGRVREAGLRVTDDTAACELIGQRVRLVSWGEPNPKVTRPEDLPYIEMLLRSRAG